MPRLEDVFDRYTKMLLGMALVFQIPTLAVFLAKINAFIDVADVPVMAAYAAGALELTDAAFDAVKRSRLQRSRVNGAPNLDFVTIPIRFPPAPR